VAQTRDNIRRWNEEYDWTEGGDEWSVAWGGPDAQWFHTLYPRIRKFVPAGTILEIAPGFGRWTQYLKDLCSSLVVVDLAQVCIDACKTRFAGSPHIRYHVTDGKSLAMVEDGSIDFAFSFDSLVHVEMDVLEAYLEQLAVKLSPDGVGFFHHSNVGVYADLIASGTMTNHHWRGESCTAEKFRRFAERVGLSCIGQELANWGQDQYLTDCMSLFTRTGSRWARPHQVVENLRFMLEAQMARSLAPLYARTEAADSNGTLRMEAQRSAPGPESRQSREQAVIEFQSRKLGEMEAQHNALRADLAQLREHFQVVERDREARLKAIEQQGRKLGEIEGQRNALRAELEQLGERFRAANEDREARLKVIEQQGWKLGEIESQRDALSAERSTLQGRLENLEKKYVAAGEALARQLEEIAALRSQLDRLNSSLPVKAMRRLGLIG
jgi:hypothetical protein